KTWKASLTVSENTGASDLWMDPRDSNVLYATSYQRRRHVWGMVHGGPESAIWKTTDAGATWRKLDKGIPKVDLGRIGLAVSPADPDVLTALVEATDPTDRGTYRSTDRGESWTRMGDYCPVSAMYYQELIPDPKKVDRLYSMDVYNQVTEDGGKTWKRLGEKHKHVDNHALWIDPADTNHLLNGNDGGVYESRDRGATWDFKANLPVTQFYRVALDESAPFYFVYGGTQDNSTLGGPSRTTTAHGIVNSDWFVTTGGDGFFCAVDPKDPNIVYSESQYAGLVRFDRRTGEEIDIQPQAGPGEQPLRWNWDAPLIISPHAHTRLYFAAQRVFRSDDRGDNWGPVSGDLTRQVDRNKLKVMGRVWSVDAVAKNTSTSLYGNIVSLAESPRKEGLLYVGTDDGLVQVTEDGGSAWRKIDAFPGVPSNAYVSDLEPSPHDEGTVFAAFDNHKMGDFKPYLLKSTDRGRTWVSIAGDLPARGSVYTVREDPEKPALLYCGTEFGLFFTPDGGKRWIQLKGGVPTIAVKDIAIQKREGDLVAATFGRGFFVLDDLTPIRRATDDMLAKEAALLPVKKAWMFVPSKPLGMRDKGFQGESYFSAPNPPFGAVFTYYLKDEIETKRKARLAAEKKVAEKGGDVFYPSWDALRTEAREEEPAVVLTVSDGAGNVVRRLTGPVKAGFQRVAWDLRYPAANPTQPKKSEDEN
ncbi:MAG: glycosyl hydrolase, partial [Thermoanaerobaculia bacterium]